MLGIVVAEDAAPPEPEPDFEVLAEVWPVLVLFLGCATQWRWISLATAERAAAYRTGLDYAGVEAVARGYGMRLDPETFGLLQVAEQGALDGWASVRR